jgi:hypothetical protein
MDDQTVHGDAAAEVTDIGLGMPRILADLAGGMLSDSEAATVADWLLATTDEAASIWLVNRAVRIAGRPLVQQAPRPSIWRRLVAALVCDTHLQPRPVGARAVAVEPRRLLYRVDSTEIDLEIGPSQITGRLRMLGQVTAGTADLARTWVASDGPSGRLEADVDSLGQFTLDGLAQGVHRLEIGLADDLIEIPAIVL